MAAVDYALVVSGSEKSRDFFLQVLKETVYTQITFVRSGNEARRLLRANDYDLVVINTPLTDEFGHDLAFAALENTSAGIILIVKNEIADEVEARVADHGVFVLAKPLNRQIFHQSLKLMAASRRRIVGLKLQNSKLQNKIEELRLVDRAKCALIQYLNMTEAQAHRYIEKQAMDLRTAKREIAQNILRNYEA
ncbi:MAG: ANTAR domain-containing protein [Gracilibacteraceae bacterium]|jgi:response regulator NasT|nr:ANTAR domain-containing protein [Gracilibacteraceae bacterium]